ISAAAPLTSIVCVAVLVSLSGPPEKKFLPPASLVASSVVRNAGVPYCTAVKPFAVVQPGSGSDVELWVAPGRPSAPGLAARFLVGTAARAGGAAASPAVTIRAASRRR